MDVLGKARRRRENFEDLTLKIVDFMKEIDEMRPLKPQNFLGAFGADYLSSAYPSLDYITPLVRICREQGGFNIIGGGFNIRDSTDSDVDFL